MPVVEATAIGARVTSCRGDGNGGAGGGVVCERPQNVVAVVIHARGREIAWDGLALCTVVPMSTRGRGCEQEDEDEDDDVGMRVR